MSAFHYCLQKQDQLIRLYGESVYDKTRDNVKHRFALKLLKKSAIIHAGAYLSNITLIGKDFLYYG